MAPMNCIGVVTEVVVGMLLQSFDLAADGGVALQVCVEGSLLGVHRGLRDVIDDKHMNALFNLEAKLNSMNFHASLDANCIERLAGPSAT